MVNMFKKISTINVFANIIFNFVNTILYYSKLIFIAIGNFFELNHLAAVFQQVN